MMIRKQLLFVAAIILAASSSAHPSTEISRVLVKRGIKDCNAESCNKNHNTAQKYVGAATGVACVFSFGLGCAVGGAILAVSAVTKLACDFCDNPQKSSVDPYQAKFAMLQQSHNTLQKNQKAIYGMTTKLCQMQNVLAYNQKQLSSDVRRVQVVLDDLKEDQAILADNQQRIFGQTNLLLGGQLQISSNQEQIFNQTLLIEARQRQTHLNQEQIANLIVNMNENLEGVVIQSQNILYKKITSFLTKTDEKQSMMSELGFTITLYGDDIQRLQSLKSKYEHMQFDENGGIIDDDESVEFQEAAVGRLHAGEIEENIFKMLTGGHPLHPKSLYQVNATFCLDTVKDYYNGLMQESFFFYFLSKAMSDQEVSSRRRNTKDKHLVQHESHYLKTCGCPDPNQYLGNRGKRLSKIFKLLTLDRNNTDVEFFLSVSELLRKNITFDVHTFKVISTFAYIDFGNQVLIELIRDTPIEDIALLAQLFLFNKDVEETQGQVKLLDDTYACYVSDKGHKNVKFSNGDLYGGFWKNSSREVFGVSVVSQNIACYSLGYSGEWAEDKMDGYGVFFWSDGSFYKGMFKQGRQQGIGTKYYPPGNRQGLERYEGEWLDGQRHGHGRLIWSNGDVFEGNFVHDAQKGNATYQWADGDRYEGKYLLDKFQDFEGLTLSNKSLEDFDASWETEDQLGIETTYLMILQNICEDNGTDCKATKIRKPIMKDRILISNGNMYLGLPENLTGCGRVIYSDNITYEGHLENGMKHGRGTMIWKLGNSDKNYFMETGESAYFNSDGRTYEGQQLKKDFGDEKKYTGQFKNDLKDGNGRFEWPNGDIYEGHFEKDIRTGHGSFIFANGNKYIGQFKDDKIHGQGKLDFASGDTYEGEFQNDAITGQGIFIRKNGDKYTGQFKNNVTHGKGIEVWINGDRYEGDYKEGQRSGQGIFTYANENKYDGQFKDDKMHGQGKLYFENGGSYEGEFQNDTLTGQGIFIYQNGDKYTGQFKNNFTHGKGIEVWIEGDRYEGDYKEGRKTGQGIYTHANGNKYVGQFKDDEMHGSGIFEWPNGDKYEGDYVEGERNGQGISTFANGNKYDGQHLNGMISGFGTYTWLDGNQYIGQFKDDQKHGQGKLEWKNGDKYEGEYLNDKRTGNGTLTWQSGNKYIGQFKDDEYHGKGKFIWADGNEYEGDYVEGWRTGQGIFTFASGNRYNGQHLKGMFTGFGTFTWPNGDKYIGQFKDDKKHGKGKFEWADGDKYEGEYRNDVRAGKGTFTYIRRKQKHRTIHN